jgi:hypothetical protein
MALAAGFALAPARAADPPAAAAAAAAAIDPQAIEALNTMGKHLRELKSFEVHADTTIDEIDDDGQKLQFGGTVDYKVKRPDRLRAEIDSDRQQRTFYYDGKTLTQYAPRMGFYATVLAPASLRELAGVLRDKYGLSLPLTDLFRWGEEKDDSAGLTGAAFIGPAKIGGAECGHYAYRQNDADWQVWISQASNLPCKLVITTLDEPEQPQYVAVFAWKPSVALDDATFTFVPPKTAHKIDVAVADSGPTSEVKP